MHVNLDRDVSIVDQTCVTKPFPKLPLSGYSRMPEVGHLGALCKKPYEPITILEWHKGFENCSYGLCMV